ncbi:unnamed protein product, partial [marine sediment metagenome]
DIIQVEPFEDGTFEAEIYIPVTEEQLVIEAVTHRRGRKIQLIQDVRIPEEEPRNYVFLVALGDLQIGNNSTKGVLDAIHDRKLEKGDYTDGRVAYYLKAKQDKWYITSGLDTKRKEKAMFRYIDPDKFYPLYGDTS